MSWRIVWRSFLEPFRSIGRLIFLAGAMLLLWAIAAMQIAFNSTEAMVVPWIVTALTRLASTYLILPAVILALPVIAGERHDRTLLPALLQPIGRVAYFSSRTLGTALFGMGYFGLVLAGFYAIVRVFCTLTFEDQVVVFPPDVELRLVLTGLSLVSVVLSVAALAPLSSGRFGHGLYWSALALIVWQAHDLLAVKTGHVLVRGLAWVMIELLEPFLLGPRAFVDLAAQSGWRLGIALVQWAFGIALAWTLGVWGFARMEAARRS